jgi:hypothetical protein
MKRTLFVVEGQTEQIFLLRFIEMLIAVGTFRVKLQKHQAGEILEISERGVPEDAATHLIYILNVQGDDSVNSYINENIQVMKSKGYSAVFGLRDLYTGSKSKAKVNPATIDSWTQELSTENNVEVQITVAIEEVEAWFLSVPTFLLSYSHQLIIERVNDILGFNLSTCQVEALKHPSKLIDKILQTVNERYRKRLDDSYKIADALDYGTLYLEKIHNLPSLARLACQLDHALP